MLFASKTQNIAEHLSESSKIYLVHFERKRIIKRIEIHGNQRPPVFRQHFARRRMKAAYELGESSR